MKPTKLKTLNCKSCGKTCYNVGDDAVAITCSICVQKSMEGIQLDSYDDTKDSPEIED